MNAEMPRGENPFIMIVDDTPANLEILSAGLRDWGYRVRTAPGGRLALQAARNDPPDLVLLDIMMPEMDGYEVRRSLYHYIQQAVEAALPSSENSRCVEKHESVIRRSSL
jgi:CheY-like chemotaxis protein